MLLIYFDWNQARDFKNKPLVIKYLKTHSSSSKKLHTSSASLINRRQQMISGEIECACVARPENAINQTQPVAEAAVTPRKSISILVDKLRKPLSKTAVSSQTKAVVGTLLKIWTLDPPFYFDK